MGRVTSHFALPHRLVGLLVEHVSCNVTLRNQTVLVDIEFLSHKMKRAFRLHLHWMTNLEKAGRPKPLDSSLQKFIVHMIINHDNWGKQLIFHFTFISCMVLGMTLNCLHRVIFWPHRGTDDLSCWSAIKYHVSLSLFHFVYHIIIMISLIWHCHTDIMLNNLHIYIYGNGKLKMQLQFPSWTSLLVKVQDIITRLIDAIPSQCQQMRSDLTVYINIGSILTLTGA